MSQSTPPSQTAWNNLLAYLRRRTPQWVLAISGLTLGSIFLLIAISLSEPLIKLAESVNSPVSDQQAILQAFWLTRHLAATPAINQNTLLQGTWIIIATILVCALASHTIYFYAYREIARLGQHLGVDLRTDYYAHLMRQGASFYRQNSTGKLLTIGMSDVETISAFISQDVPTLLNVALQLVLTLGIMLWKNPTLAVISAMLAAIIYWASTYSLVPRINQRNKHYGQQYAQANTRFTEDLNGLRDIQIFRQEARTTREWRATLQTMAQTLTQAHELSFLNLTIAFGASSLGMLLIYGLGAQGIVFGVLDAGLLIAFARVFDQFINAIRNAGPLQIKFGAILVAMERVSAILATPPEIVDQPAARDPGRLTGHIKFEGVAFTYDRQDPKAWRIQDIDLEIRPGEKVAFVGGSGSGKSTLLNLVARFYDPTWGRVLIDGVDIKEMKLEALRRNLGLVAQSVVLFDGTLADNIRFARPDADLAAVERAAQIGYVTEFLEKLPQGYETVLGTSGQSLSGGQKQRVSIARAALADPVILLLDEATSALDAQSEAQVNRMLDELSGGRTTLVITHRLNTIKNADKIVVLGTDKQGYGMIKAVGTHDVLLEKSPDYVKLYGQIKKKSIILPLGPRYDTTAALPTVIGLAQAYHAPVYLLDFGLIPDDPEVEKNFGITILPGQDATKLNVAHVLRVERIARDLSGEGLEVVIVRPADPKADWVNATIRAVNDTEASHLVAVDNVLVPLDKLRESIRTIERKAAVEYILVNPIAGVG